MIADTFIQRPNTAIVISLFILLLGILAINTLPVSQYPNITPPVIQVTATYTGADAETIEQTVMTPLETEINGTPGMAYIESTASSEGRLTMNITFEVGTDIDVAAVEVQNRISVAEPLLPEEVRRLGIVVRKRNPSILLIVSILSPNGTHGIDFLNNYTNIFVKDELLRVPGVGDIFARAEDFSMRIWLKPDRLSQLGITANEAIAALQEQNLQVAAGRIGAPPQTEFQSFEYTVFTNGRLQTVEEFENVILKNNPENNALVYLRDVARVELGRFDYATNNFTDGYPAAYLLVYQTPESNILDTEQGIRETMERLKENFPKDLDYIIPFESASVVSESISEVVKTLFIALGLVILVVFVFLQNWRATLIPILIIPVSIIGTFALFIPLGFTINTLTLFGFVLAIGIVVDDAIVVVEATSAIMEKKGVSAKEAVTEAMKQISGPVIAMSLIVAAVFVPVGFIPGIIGRLYQQFAMAVAVSGLISGFVALSLTPALCSLLLKPSSINEKSKGLDKFFHHFNRLFDKLQKKYDRGVEWSLGNIKIIIAGLILLGAATIFMFQFKSTGFIPTEDEGRLFVTFELPEGSSTNRTLSTINKLMEVLQEQEEVLHFSGVTGLNAVNFATKSNSGTVFTQLTPWDKRKGKGQNAFEVRDRLEKILAEEIPEAEVVIIAPPAIPGLGSTSGFTFIFQEYDNSGDIKDFEANLKNFIGEINGHEDIGSAFSFFSASTPAYQVNLDREKTARLGVNIGEAYQTLQTYLGSIYVNDFILYNRNFRVLAQADSAYRESPESLSQFFLRNSEGGLTPLSNLTEVKLIENAPLISHFNLFRSATINGEAAQGKSSGDAIRALEEVADNSLPSGYGFEFSGITREEVATGGSTLLIFLLSIIFVFLCLTALYESWSVPFSVLMAVPTGAFGAIITLLLIPRLENNVYAQIGLLTLIGLAAKNAILIVEYAKERVDGGMDIKEAVIEASKLRLRPIIMTSLAFILGIMPLVFAGGAGALARQTIGWTVFGGMTMATLMTIFIVPVLFVLITGWAYSEKELAALKEKKDS
ncbi:efflux RND transporter permease subunit [Mongoliibacter ruber]|uniref:HAE1 family hydrophobic/amphiphilic exporter-1 n=1 Tax=Mongoliibacter ruber TaxID=1750599 RepID=A0A2T0WSF4_9BACT|nr:efflux RND transporter permease subunit [Mongoliibacter ruber]PRY89629.1 HAE1 family hydrophobic/amphiphilic exporter-1 [Mongoliibacter ruber]